jgi:formate dehydrogenase major subunit
VKGQDRCDEPLIEDITREFNRGMWTIGYTGQSPERLKLHMANQHTFDKTTLQGQWRPGGRRLLRPALAVVGHAGDEAPRHAEPLRHLQAGCRRRLTSAPASASRSGRRGGGNLLAEGSYSVGSEIRTAIPSSPSAC